MKCSTGARRRGRRLRLYEGEEPGEQQDTEIHATEGKREIICPGNSRLRKSCGELQVEADRKGVKQRDWLRT